MSELTQPTGQEESLRAKPRADGTAPRALVLGATGYIGGRLTPRLLAAGYRVRVLARDAGRVAAFPWGGECEVVEGDAADADAVAEAMADVDVVYYLIHSMSAGSDFEEKDERAAQNVADAAKHAGVGRLIYLGGLHPSDAKLSAHLRSRVRVGEIFLESGVPTLVLQAGVVIGSGSASFEMIRHLTDVLPYMPAPKWVRNHIQPIAVRDVLHYLLGAARVDADVNQAVDVGGPDVLRYGQMMNGYALEAGLRQRAIASLPVLTPWLASHWVNLVTPVPRSIARPLVASLQNECVAKDHAVDDLIPRPADGLTPYRRAVAMALGRADADSVETSWRDSEVNGAPSDPLPSDPDWAGRTVFTDERSLDTSADLPDLWAVIVGIGGENGWYSSGFLWAVRGWMDRLVGGVGLRRGRRSRSHVTVGDALDFWRVETLHEPDAEDAEGLLRLRAEMKVPGAAWLELRARETAEGSHYEQRAVFFPRGLFGRLYWLAVLPFHGFIFSGMAARITAAAEEREKARAEEMDNGGSEEA
ncbi:Nucleoside-diphosphate-sugar epimerase [Microbacterium esteraromaticum]|uniref:Nucleoside-diphosphate-sugar epimerase n=1 Tax=Microbacterium esteraromaticum TaxID=57043 RepID=A0A1R4IN20_9MICO|nr:SDR family oxidoreductase [Microbacterium esteraromaticum]SJN21024.1 Nucleoside-diphosphate-sugar epimerase [Microbacterium esteraromaticum]